VEKTIMVFFFVTTIMVFLFVFNWYIMSMHNYFTLPIQYDNLCIFIFINWFSNTYV